MDFSQFLSNVLSTIVGVGLAIWGAIWLDRKTHKQTELIGEKEKKLRAFKVLSLINKELNYNLSALKTIDDNVPSTYKQLNTESWRAFSDGGEIKYIDNPDLLNSISIAYASIKQFMVLYNKFFDSQYFPSENTYSSLGDSLRNHTMKLKSDSIDFINQAIDQIEKIILKNN